MSDASTGIAIGVDLGGTKTEALALDRGGQEILRRRVTSPHDYGATVTAIRDLVTGFENELGASATVGVGHPGALDPGTGLIKNANPVWLLGKPFDRDLAAALGRPVALANDANCLALSEATDGSGTGAACVFAVIVGTGVGGGIAVHGRILRGPNGIAGEWGHDALPWPTTDELPGPACYCGLSGCVETWLSGPGMAADHARLTGAELDPPAIVAAAELGDSAAEATLERYEDRMARALAGVVNILDPDVIVLGGGLSRLRRLYDNVPHLLHRHAFAAGARGELRTQLAPALHGDSSGVRGAAWLGRELVR
jgi:fructokinase